MPWAKPETIPLNLYWNESLRDHAVSKTCPGEGYEVVEANPVARTYLSPLCCGNGMVLRDSTAKISDLPRVLAENVLLPSPDWELRFRLETGDNHTESDRLVLTVVNDNNNETIRVKLVVRDSKKGKKEHRILVEFDSLAGSKQVMTGTLPVKPSVEHCAITFISNKLTVYYHSLCSCFMQIEGFTGNQVSILTHTEDDSTPLSSAILNDITLFEIDPISHWEFVLDDNFPEGMTYHCWGAFIEQLHHAHYGNCDNGDFLNITDKLQKSLKKNNIPDFKVNNAEFNTKYDPKNSRCEMNMIYLPTTDYYPYTRAYRQNAQEVVELWQMWNDQLRKHILTIDRQHWEAQGYRTLRSEGYAYKNNQTDMLLTGLELYSNSTTHDVCAVTTQSNVERLENLGGYTLLSTEAPEAYLLTG